MVMVSQHQVDERFRRHFNSITDKGTWEEYSSRLEIPNRAEEQHFFRHVIFEHFDDFTRRFPWFRTPDFDFAFEDWTAERIHREIRYDAGEELDWWYSHVERRQGFPLLTYMET